MAKVILTQYVQGEKTKLKGRRKALLAFLSGLVHVVAQMRRHDLGLDQAFSVNLPEGLKLIRYCGEKTDFFAISPADLQNPDFISELKKARYKLATR